jgi:hypothetical protein
VLVDGSAARLGANTGARKNVGDNFASPDFGSATLTERRLTVVSLLQNLGEAQHQLRQHHRQQLYQQLLNLVKMRLAFTEGKFIAQ